MYCWRDAAGWMQRKRRGQAGSFEHVVGMIRPAILKRAQRTVRWGTSAERGAQPTKAFPIFTQHHPQCTWHMPRIYMPFPLILPNKQGRGPPLRSRIRTIARRSAPRTCVLPRVRAGTCGGPGLLSRRLAASQGPAWLPLTRQMGGVRRGGRGGSLCCRQRRCLRSICSCAAWAWLFATWAAACGP